MGGGRHVLKSTVCFFWTRGIKPDFSQSQRMLKPPGYWILWVETVISHVAFIVVQGAFK